MISDELLKLAKILIVDDEETNNRLLKNILKKEGFINITSITDSRLACQLYNEIDPDLLILDLNMPYKNGFEVMEELSSQETESYLPIIIISSDDTQETRFHALKSGGKDFLNKPYDRVEVIIRIRNLIEVRMLHNEVRNQNQNLEVKVKERTRQLYDTQLEVIQRLARAIEYRDSETGMHISRMSHYSACLAQKCGLDRETCELILAASPLHDVGKIAIPDRILCKPGKLDAEEWEIMKGHTVIGAEILSGGGHSKFLEIGKEIASSHHEKWDGTGYPTGLKGENIPLAGRICCICDVFDALTTERPYKKAWTIDEAVEEIAKNKGTQFDPKIVDYFMDILPQIKEIYYQYIDKNNNE